MRLPFAHAEIEIEIFGKSLGSNGKAVGVPLVKMPAALVEHWRPKRRLAEGSVLGFDGVDEFHRKIDRQAERLSVSFDGRF